MKFSVANLELWYEMHSNEALVSLLDSLTLDMAKWNFLKGKLDSDLDSMGKQISYTSINEIFGLVVVVLL